MKLAQLKLTVAELETSIKELEQIKNIVATESKVHVYSHLCPRVTRLITNEKFKSLLLSEIEKELKGCSVFEEFARRYLNSDVFNNVNLANNYRLKLVKSWIAQLKKALTTAKKAEA